MISHQVLPCISLMKVKVKSLSHVQLFATLWTVAHQASPPSMGFSRQEYWSRLPFSSLGDLPDPGIEPESLALALIPTREAQLAILKWLYVYFRRSKCLWPASKSPMVCSSNVHCVSSIGLAKKICSGFPLQCYVLSRCWWYNRYIKNENLCPCEAYVLIV